LIPEFNLYEEFWKIYTNQSVVEPQYIGPNASISKAIIGAGDVIDGEINGCVFGPGVKVGKGSVIRDSIIMSGTTIGGNCVIEKAIIAEDTVVGDDVKIGIGEEKESKLNSSIYGFGLAVIGQGTVIPDNVTIGKNTAIRGETSIEDYPGNQLESGGYIIKAGDES
jgi:glucose-1-phosphate adenylyltransferase